MKNIEDKWHPEAYSQGCMARLIGHPLSESVKWYEYPGYMRDSWEAGWKYADEDPDAPKSEIRYF